MLTPGETKLAAYLLKTAASTFSNHGCNDMEPAAFGGITSAELAKMLVEVKAWSRDDSDATLIQIPDWLWMEYLAARLTGDVR